jgi:hypothetical protein
MRIRDSSVSHISAVCPCGMPYNNNNNNQAFYSQASWGRLEMKAHKPKKQVQNKSEKEGENKGR